MSFDIIVVGGSYAGISAALQVARARRQVLVVDAGSRRNRFARSAHGFLGHDGRAPGELAALARAELLAYPTVTWIDDAATDARATGSGFAVTLASGDTHEAARLILATGVVDELPAVPGLAERWGTRVFHCPYCHGYELDRGRIGVLGVSALSPHAALMLPDWGATTYFSQGQFEPDDDTLAAFSRRGVAIEREPVTALDGELTLRLGDGRAIELDGLFVMSTMRVAGPLAAALGCEIEDSPLGTLIKVDARKETTVPGVFACGDAAVMPGAIAIAVSDGFLAGTAAHQSLIFRS